MIVYLILLQFFMNSLLQAGAWMRFVSPVDGLDAAALQRYYPRTGDAIRMEFYVKSGDKWQRPGERGGPRWSGYATFAGGRYRYAQARVYIGSYEEEKKSERERRVWKEGGVIDNIPTRIPASCLPDYRPVMKLVRWLGERAVLKLRYGYPMEDISAERIADTDPLLPGNQGEFGAYLIDANGVRRIKRGVDLKGIAGETPVFACALGKVVLVSRKGERKACVLDQRTGEVRCDYPPGRPDKGSVLKDYGNCVYVSHPDGYTIRYAHLGTINVEAGQGVIAGTRIGTVGESMLVPSGVEMSWVHIEVRRGDPFSDKDSVPLDPLDFFRVKEKESAEFDES